MIADLLRRLLRLVRQLIGLLQKWGDRPIIPVEFPPPDAFFQDPIRLTTIAALAPFTTVETFRVPTNRLAIARFLGIEPNDPAALLHVRFRFLLNGSIFRNYQAPPALIGSLDVPTHIFIWLEEQNTLELQLSNVTGVGAFTVFYRLQIWWWDPRVYHYPVGIKEGR